MIDSFPGWLAKQAAGERSAGDGELLRDSIRVGDLLLAVNGQKLASLPDVYQILQSIPDDSAFTLNIFRPTENRNLTYRVAKTAHPDNFFRELLPTAYVYDVFKDGASDRAGMKVGDLIFRINGHNFKNSGEADLILRRAQIGKTIMYEVIRNNRAIALQVTLAKYGMRFSLLVLVLCGLVYMAVGAFIATQRPKIKAARLTGQPEVPHEQREILP